jgi:fructose-1,6-bisphosphatase II
MTKTPSNLPQLPVDPTRNLALDLVRVTEAAALSAGREMGRGNKIAADRAAVDAMRLVLNSIDMEALVVIGEGEKDEAPMLYNGEILGKGGAQMDLAVDPIDGTRPVALGLWNAISVVALAPRGTMFDPGPGLYMQKIAVGAEASGLIDLEAPVADNLAKVAQARGKHIHDLTVVIIDRPRHTDLVREVRECGARIRLIPDGDVAGALLTAMPDAPIDVLLGVGGSPEGVIAACGLRCLGGDIQGRLVARTPEEKRRGEELGFDFKRILRIEDLVTTNDVFFAATGITNGDLLRGVDYFGHGARTDSMVMRGLTGTYRRIQAIHRLDKLEKISSIPY